MKFPGHRKFVAELQACGFYLTGSRALGRGFARRWSDWDFAGWDSKIEEDCLKSYGFERMKVKKRLLDDITSSVWILRAGGRRYEVVLVKDLAVKIRAIGALKMNKELATYDRQLRLNRKARRRFWNTLFFLAGYQKESK